MNVNVFCLLLSTESLRIDDEKPFESDQWFEWKLYVIIMKKKCAQ